jgi:putative flippase GtrA
METLLNRSISYFLGIFYPPFKKIMPFQVYTYLACGAVNTALNILLFALFYQVILPLPGVTLSGHLIPSYTISLVVAFLITVPTGFWLNKQFAFRQEEESKRASKRQAWKYFLVVLQGLLSDYLLMLAFIILLHLHPTIAKILSTVIVLSLNYVLQKHFTFKAAKQHT